jgi:hypothetical protein
MSRAPDNSDMFVGSLERQCNPITRRTLLKVITATGAVALLPPQLLAQADGKDEILRYLESLARGDGGYAWEDQERSHLTPTFAVIGCYRALKSAIPRAKQVAEFVRTHHPATLKKLEQERRVFDFQQVQALAWLRENAREAREKVAAWKQPVAYMKAYEQHGWPVFSSEIGAFTCRKLLGLPLDDLAPHFTAYLDARRRANGSFNNTPAENGGDGHVMNTWSGLQALAVLGRIDEKKTETAEWLRACQLESGGFTWQPRPEFAGVDDVAYTWAAVRALHLLGSAPQNREACVQWLYSLANGDGGFSDRRGWLSNPMATYYALEALDTLGALHPLPELQRRAPRPRVELPSGLRVFSMQIEAHGQGSPAEAVDLARALRIHLWGAKNAKPEWLDRAQAIADEQKVPVKFFVANEEYGTWVNVPGLGTYSHTSDIVAPVGAEIGDSLANQGVVSWPEFREKRLDPLHRGGGRLIWQFGENEELVRLFLDDSLERGGYAAISTFHFGNPDFTNSEPFLQRWRGRIPYVALQDAHGPEPWWFADMTTGFRTVFLATEPTWEGWLQALKQNWVVAVRHDAISGGKTWMHSGSREVLDFVRAHERDWRWWDNPEIGRPLVSIVAVKPGDTSEAARPERGIMLRVRCAWENTPQGIAKKPITELVKLSVDGAEVSPTLVEKKKGPGYADHYHQFHLDAPTAGKHSATVVVRVIESKVEHQRTIEFAV